MNVAKLDPIETTPTSQQRKILALVAVGYTTKEIAARLAISEDTVKWHLARSFETLGARSRSEAVAIAIERRLISVSKSKRRG